MTPHRRSCWRVCCTAGSAGLRAYTRDGGEELQVNEVLLGSGWLFAAMLRHYGLAVEADDVATSMCGVLYGGTGLQFRTPAGSTGTGGCARR